METLEYSASLDNLTKGISAGVIILLGFMGYRSLKTLLNFNNLDTTSILIHSAVVILFLGIIIGSYLLSPKSYSLNSDSLVINKVIKTIIIPYKEIKKIHIIKPEEMNGTIRTFGNGGLFGYYGKFHNQTFGSMNFQTTQKENRLLIETNKNIKYIISPDDLSLAKELEKRIGK